MKTQITNWDKRWSTITVDKLPPNVSNGDIIIAAPSGEIRNHFDLKWYQKTWLWVDKKMRNLLKIDL